VTDPALDLLVLSDLHYIGTADDVCTIEERNCDLGPSLIRDACQRLQGDGIVPDLLVLLGDLVNDGLADGAEEDLAQIAQSAQDAGLSLLAVPGNHDGEAADFVSLFGCAPGLHEVAGYGFLVFHDLVAPDHATTRAGRDLTLPREAARQHPDLPLVALQHNPLHPPIDHEYPFIITNADRVLEGYCEAGVILSLSGHYHPGQAAHPVDGTVYYTLPAACEVPFSFAHIRLRGRSLEVCQRALAE
jgi:hypothetical protein